MPTMWWIAVALAQEAPSQIDLEAACSDGDGGACTVLGLLLAEGVRVPPDRERATGLLTEQCDSNADIRACRGLGLLLVDGVAPPDDVPRGAVLLEQACIEGDDWPSCARLGDLWIDGGDPRAAMQSWGYACQGGFLYGCSRFAAMTLSEKKPWKSPEEVAALQQLCELGEPYACEQLDGRSIPRSGPAKPKR